MKKSILTLTLLTTTLFSFSQIQTRPLPKPGFEQRIKDHVNSIKIIDTHEHLRSEEQILEKAPFDFTKLFQHYLQDDFISSGMSKSVTNLMSNEDVTLDEKWQILKPYWQHARTTGYGRVSLIAAKDLFGFDDINDDTYKALSEKINETVKPGYYNDVFDKAGIDLAILDVGDQDYNSNQYRYVRRYSSFIYLLNAGDVYKLGDDISTLDDLLSKLESEFQKDVDKGIVAVKSALAYIRIIKYENVLKPEAEKVFKKLMDPDNIIPLSFEEVKPLQDFMMHQVIKLAQKNNLPIQFHTGLQAGNGNIISNSDPTNLTNLFFQYPDVKFCLFHSSYPYGGELSTLAKNFPNVYIDMCWSAIISPGYSVRYLSEWLETVPNNKIMVFGGDYLHIEGTYAHSVMAREIVSNVLIQKVKDGFYTEEEAFYIANRILRQNAIDVFGLFGSKGTNAELPELKTKGQVADLWEMVKTETGLISSWKVIGPFDIGTSELTPNSSPPGFENKYAPEKEFEFDKTYNGTGDIEVKWQNIFVGKTGMLDFNQCIFPAGEGIAYAYAEIISPDDREVTFTLGSDDGAKMFVNGDLVYSEHVWRGAKIDETFINAKLKKGKNTILVKVENRGINWGLVVRTIDPKHELKLVVFE